jgi:hypothetical protein
MNFDENDEDISEIIEEDIYTEEIEKQKCQEIQEISPRN